LCSADAEASVTISNADREAVEALLYSEDPGSVVTALAGMASEQLHLLMCRYNWDDGFALPRAVLHQPKCERGTALFIYWALGGAFAEQDAKGEHRALLEEARSRLLSGTVPEQGVEYDPVADWELNKLQVAKLERAGFPTELIRASRRR
jgi:hypothetical protein